MTESTPGYEEGEDVVGHGSPKLTPEEQIDQVVYPDEVTPGEILDDLTTEHDSAEDDEST